MTPKSAAAIMQNVKAEFRSYPQIAVGKDAKDAKKKAMAEAAHRSSVARWEQGTTAEFLPGGAFEGLEQY